MIDSLIVTHFTGCHKECSLSLSSALNRVLCSGMLHIAHLRNICHAGWGQDQQPAHYPSRSRPQRRPEHMQSTCPAQLGPVQCLWPETPSTLCCCSVGRCCWLCMSVVSLLLCSWLHSQCC